MSCLDVMHPAYGHYAPYAPTAPAFINSLQVGRDRNASMIDFLCDFFFDLKINMYIFFIII